VLFYGLDYGRSQSDQEPCRSNGASAAIAIAIAIAIAVASVATVVKRAGTDGLAGGICAGLVERLSVWQVDQDNLAIGT
jgi:hypothetical protein